MVSFLLLGVVPISLFVFHASKTSTDAVSQMSTPSMQSLSDLELSAPIDWWLTHSGPLMQVDMQTCAVYLGMAARVLNKLACWSEPIYTLNYCFLLANHCCFLHISTPHNCAGLYPLLPSQAFTLVILEHGSLPNTFASCAIKGISCLPNDCEQMQAWGNPAGSAPSSAAATQLLQWGLNPSFEMKFSSRFVPSLAV